MRRLVLSLIVVFVALATLLSAQVQQPTGCPRGDTGSVCLGSGGSPADTVIVVDGVAYVRVSRAGVITLPNSATISGATLPFVFTSQATGDSMYASSATAWSRLAVGASAGMFMRSTGTLPGWSTLILPNAATAGDLIVATATNTVGSVVDVGTGQVLTSGGVGVVPAYSASPTVTSLTATTLSTSTVSASSPQVTAGSGTGITVNNAGEIRTEVYKVTILSTNFIAAAVTADVTIATLPAKTFVLHAVADLTTTFACTATCTTGTLSATLGKTAGGNEYLLSWDADAATAVFGDAAAELGASLAPATVQTMNGDLGSWSTTTAVNMRLTSGTGNIGTGAATNLSQGTVTIYLTTVKMP